VHSGRSFRLFVGPRTLGILSLFSREAYAFSSETEIYGGLFATHASVALAGTRREREFTKAVRNRDVIGQAKGVLMARHRLNEDEAFATLVKFSQTQGLKLFDIAAQLMNAVTREAVSRAPRT